MRKNTFVALCLVSSMASAQPPVDPSDTQLVIIETYLHYFTVKEVFQQCGSSVIPEQSEDFSKAFSVWENRNKSEIAFINSAFSTYFTSRPKDAQEMADAAPTIVHDQYLLSPYSQELCMGVLTTTNTIRPWDYSLKFPEHLEILKSRLATGTSSTTVNTRAVQ